jgi:tRNA threonylcarbamoyladenosine biosynthesis protein TsaB
MTILALEFSSVRRSAAVLDRGGDSVYPASRKVGTLARPSPPAKLAEAIETGPGGTNAFGLIEKALAVAGLTRERIEIIAVGLGPGSYTGIRVALSLAQGWQLARGVKLLGISSAECLAAQAQAEKILGHVHVVIDAQRNEFYLAPYEISALGWKEVQPLRIVPLAQLKSGIGAGEIPVGPEVTRWLPEGKNLFPSAATLGRLAAERGNFVRGDRLTPIYLRETMFVKAPPANRFLP